jgi:hypothetical protein
LPLLELDLRLLLPEDDEEPWLELLPELKLWLEELELWLDELE